MNTSTKLQAIFLTLLLVGSTFGANIALAEVTSGGTVGEAGPAEAVVVPDATINSSSDSSIEIAYNASSKWNTDYLKLSIETATGSKQIDVTSTSGTVSYTITQGDLAGGNHTIAASLIYSSPDQYEVLDYDAGQITSSSPVEITSSSFESGPYYPGLNYTFSVSLHNPTTEAENYTLALYQDAYRGVEPHRSGSTNRHVSRTVEVPAESTISVEMNASWAYMGQETIWVNDHARKDAQVQSPLEATDVQTNVSTVAPGGTVQLIASVENVHSPAGSYRATPAVDGRTRYSEKKRLSYDAGESKELTFNITLNSEGEREVGVLGNSTTVTVESPLNVTDLSVPNETVYTKTNTTVQTTVTNEGSTNGTYQLTAYSQYDRYLGSTDVTLNASESKQVSFNVTLQNVQTDRIRVGSETASVDPKTPFSLKNSSANVSSAEVGEDIQFSFNISNDYASTGDYQFTFQVGTNFVRKTVTLEAGKTTEVTFVGSHSVPGTRTTQAQAFDAGGVEVDVASPVEVQSIENANKTAYSDVPTSYNATVENTGEAGEYVVAAMSERGYSLGKTTVTLGAGETRTVEVPAEFYTDGNQTVSINGEQFTAVVDSPLNITTTFDPETAVAGQETSAYVYVANEHGPEQDYRIGVSAYEAGYYERKTIHLSEGGTGSLAYSFTFMSAGEKRVRVGDESMTITVTNPLNATAYSFNKTAPLAGEPVRLNLTVTNTGEAGTYPVSVGDHRSNTLYATKEVEFAAGETKNVSLVTSFGTPKQYTLDILNKSEVGLPVRSPVKVQNYSLSDSDVYVGEQVTVTANVTNTGGNGTYELPITRWGQTIGSTRVTLDKGETKQIEITFSSQNPIESRDRVSFANTTLDDFSVGYRLTTSDVVVNDGVAPGEKVTVEVTFTNPTSETASKSIDRTLGSSYDGQSITVDPGQSKTVTITGSYAQSGTYYEWIGTDSVRVFVYDQQDGEANLTINDQYFPSEAVVGQQLYVPVKFTNVGNATGIREVNFSVDGKQIGSQRVSAAPGDSSYVWFDTTFDTVGEHTYTVDNTTHTVTVKEEVITNSSIEYVDGTEPFEMPKLTTRYSSYGLYVALADSSGSRDLTRVGADTSTTFRVNVTVRDYDPNVIVDTGSSTTWSTTKLGPNKTRVSVLISPSNMQYRFDAPRLENWGSTNDSADTAIPAGAWMRIGDGEYSRYAVNGSALEGMTISTNAQRFRQPKFIPGTNDTAPRLEVKLAGPHLTVNGEVYDGHYSAFLPDSLLDEWNVTDPSQLTVEYSADSGDTEFTVEEVTGGVRVTVQLHYSAGVVSIEKKSTGATDSTEETVDESTGEDGDTSESSETQETTSDETSSTTSSTGGGGGQGGEATASIETIDTSAGVTTYISDVPTGGTANVDLSGSVAGEGIDIRSLRFDFTFAHEDRARIEVTDPAVPSDRLDEINGGSTVATFDVEASGLKSSALDSATFEFSINSNALPEGAAMSDLSLYHRTDGTWTRLETTSLGDGVFEATTTGFSKFAIVVQPSDSVSTTATPTDNAETTETAPPTATEDDQGTSSTDEQSPPETQTDAPGFGIAAAMLSLFGVIFLLSTRE